MRVFALDKSLYWVLRMAQLSNLPAKACPPACTFFLADLGKRCTNLSLPDAGSGMGIAAVRGGQIVLDESHAGAQFQIPGHKGAKGWSGIGTGVLPSDYNHIRTNEKIVAF